MIKARKTMISSILTKIGHFQRFISVGEKYVTSRVFTVSDLDSFGRLTGDWNEIHFRAERNTSVVHGALLNGFVSAAIGCHLPGPRTILVEQTLKFPNPCYVGENVQVMVTMKSVRKIMECEFTCQVDEKVVLCGTAKVIKKEESNGN